MECAHVAKGVLTLTLSSPPLSLPFRQCLPHRRQHVIAERNWYISGYHFSYKHPITEQTLPLCSDVPAEQSLFRVVVKANLTRQLAEDLLVAVRETVVLMDEAGAGFRDMHRKKVARPVRGRHVAAC